MTLPIPDAYHNMTVGVTTAGGDIRIPGKWGEEVFACRVTTQHNTWLNLDDHERYIVAADSFGDTATQMRRTQVQSPYVPGKYTVGAIADQVMQNMSFYVLGVSQTELQLNLADLIDVFTQPAYRLVWSVGEVSYTWDCECADYTISFVNTGLFARTLNVKFQVPRNPATILGASS